MKKPVYRHELKYRINLPEWALLRSRLPAGVQRDEHAGENGEYMIRSLYFDDYWNTAYEEKEIGVHPNDNTATLWISFQDLEGLIREHGNETAFAHFDPQEPEA